MNFEEIVKELKSQNIDKEDFGYGDMKNPLPNIGSWKEVEQNGGEGEGERWNSVKYFPDHDVYININAHYTSYDGCDFNYYDFQEVRPQQKTITVYE